LSSSFDANKRVYVENGAKTATPKTQVPPTLQAVIGQSTKKRVKRSTFQIQSRLLKQCEERRYAIETIEVFVDSTCRETLGRKL